MTREQVKLLRERFSLIMDAAEEGKNDLTDVMHNALIKAYLAGAEDALLMFPFDNWISVEDELPPYGMQVLVYSEQNIEYEMWFSKRYTAEDAILLGVDGTKWCEVITDKNGFCTLRDKLNVTHWRNIEPPRKEDEL